MPDIYKARFGAFDDFLFEHKADSPIHAAEIVAIPPTLGTTNMFSLDNANIIDDTQTISLDGVAQVEGVDYNIVNATGAITWIGGDPSGLTLQADTYRFRHRVRFSDDGFEQTSIYRSDAFGINVSFITVPS